MKILLLSNHGMSDEIIGNPIMLRMKCALQNNSHIDEVLSLTCNKPFNVWKELRDKAKKVDVIHIHFGGAYAMVVWIMLLGINRPKLITFHGTDIHAKAIKTTKSLKDKIKIRINQWASFLSIILFDKIGFVAEEMLEYVPQCLNKQLKKKCFIQKLGVDYNTFIEVDRIEAQKRLRLDSHNIYALFSDVSGTSIKRRDIAQCIINELGPQYKLIVMCGVMPNEVPLYINSSDFLLLTSDEEGSPNIIRECLALNKPVFSVDVGDARMQLEGLRNSAIISRNPKEAADVIRKTLNETYTDRTRNSKQNELDLNCIINDVILIYKELCYK